MRNKGFTLIELMIVVAIIAIIAAIAIPSLLRSRMAANGTAAAASCKAYAEAQEIYRRTDYDGDAILEYSQAMKGANSLVSTTGMTNDLQLIDRTFAGAAGNPGVAGVNPKAGYCFGIQISQTAAAGIARGYIPMGTTNMTLGYGGMGIPAAYDQTGRDSYIINGQGTIFQRDLGATGITLNTTFDPTTQWTPTE